MMARCGDRPLLPPGTCSVRHAVKKKVCLVCFTYIVFTPRPLARDHTHTSALDINRVQQLARGSTEVLCDDDKGGVEVTAGDTDFITGVHTVEDASAELCLCSR